MGDWQIAAISVVNDLILVTTTPQTTQTSKSATSKLVYPLSHSLFMAATSDIQKLDRARLYPKFYRTGEKRSHF